jgi:hypothetical protein
MSLLVFSRITNIKDLPNEIIKAQRRAMRDQPIGIWCILKIHYSLESK